jgi:hypothetical protein
MKEMFRSLNQQRTGTGHDTGCIERAISNTQSDIVKYVFDRQSEGVSDIYKTIENAIKSDPSPNKELQK